MATAEVISPSIEKADYMRTHALLVDGGTLVLRGLLERTHPAGQWDPFLKTKSTRDYVKCLKRQKVITEPQYNLLYPPSSGTSDPCKYDISLIVCLLRNFCGFNTDPNVWKGIPPTTGLSEEADIRRLQIKRNELAHKVSASMSKQEFDNHWRDIEEVLTRLNKNVNVPDLQQNIDNLKTECIDPDRESQLIKTIQMWEDMDKALREDIKDVKDKVEEHNLALDSLSNDVNALKSQTVQLQSKVNESTEEATKISAELNNIIACTKMFLEDSMLDKVYVYTSLYTEAMIKWNANNIVVLSGHPGEGKTTMAMKLMLKVTTIDKCLRLAQPSDWRFVDMEMFDTIFIDDIFGPGVLDARLVKCWERHLPEIWKAVQEKQLKVIIATRHYILEEAKQIFSRSPLFNKEHVQFLSSEELSTVERKQMLQAHIQHNIIIEDNDMLISECVEASSNFGIHALRSGKPSFLFGFPECARMFVQNEDLFKRGANFFKSPDTFFRLCLEDLRKDEDRFLALLIIWSRPNKRVLNSELDLSSTSVEITEVTKMFGFKLKGKLLKTLKNSLKHHTHGFIRYSPSSGAYGFNHKVISDMVGLVISEDYPTACLELTDREFLMKYITIDETTGSEFSFLVEPCLHTVLVKTFLRVAIREHHPKISMHSEFDEGIFNHKAFTDIAFVHTFVAHLVNEEEAVKIFAKPVKNVSGYMLPYGFQLEKMFMCMPSYALLHSKVNFFIELLSLEIFPLEGDEMYLGLLIATHENHFALVNALIKNGVEVSKEAIYVAAVKQHVDILKLLLESSDANALTRCEFDNNNNALMAAAKMGNADSVKLLTAYTDLSLRNDHNVSALDKAILNEHEEVARILIDNGAPINEKGGKFKRTPLHTACDKGLSGTVDILLKAGAQTDLRDQRGHYPIHCAAIQNHVDVVRVLALHDTSQVQLRITSYGTSSAIKGMTVFHVAVWKDNKEMIENLLEITKECNAHDWLKRTPIYCASYDGKDDIVKLLLPFGDVNKPEKRGYTPLHAAIHKGRASTFQLLLPYSNVNAQDTFGSTPLHTACRKGQFTIITQLLEANADPHMITKRGDTVYHILIRKRIEASVYDLSEEVEFCIEIIKYYSPDFLSKLKDLPNKCGRIIHVSNDDEQ